MLLGATLLLQACASPMARCGLVDCGLQRDALLKVTAAQLPAPPETIRLWDIRSYPGGTVAWRARHAGRDYQCREARDAAAPGRVKFVYCRPAT